MKRIRQIFFATITVIISLIVVDFALHAAVLVSPRINEVTSFVSAKIPDERLGHRPNPAYPGHDENGFRNPRVPETAQIVALGDSQTYGSGVSPDQAWPRVLEEVIGRSVYSMALGGYGPVHSLLLWDEAIALKPEIVIEGIYAGNDNYDSYSMVYRRSMLPELKTGDKNQLELVRQSEVSEPLHKKVSKTYRRGRTTSGRSKKIKSWLTKHSRIYGLLRRAQHEFKRIGKTNRTPPGAEDEWRKAEAFAKKHSNYMQIFSGETSRTTFTSEYRLTALNLDDPRIREGQRISLEAIRRMHQLAIRESIRFIVLLIPTKELVFSEQARALDAPNYHALIRNELKFWREIKLFLDQHSIEYLDALPPLQAELEAGPQPYWVSRNGHPNEHGQRAIAHAVGLYLDPDRQREGE